MVLVNYIHIESVYSGTILHNNIIENIGTKSDVQMFLFLLKYDDYKIKLYQNEDYTFQI